MKKKLLTIGTLLATSIPLVAVISCSDNPKKYWDSTLVITNKNLPAPIVADMKKFSNFNQYVTASPKMLTLNSHPSEAYLGWLVGHSTFPTATTGVWRDYKVIDINDQGTLHIQITFWMNDHSTKLAGTVKYRIIGFKTK